MLAVVGLKEKSSRKQMKKYFWLVVVINCLFEVGVNFIGLLQPTGWLYQLVYGIVFAINPFGWLLAGLKWPGSMYDVLLTHAVIVGGSVACICLAGFLREQPVRFFRILGTLLLSAYVLLGIFSFVASVF